MKKIILILFMFITTLFLHSCIGELSFIQSIRVVKKWVRAVNEKNHEGIFYHVKKNSDAFRFAKDIKEVSEEGRFRMKCHSFSEILSVRECSRFYVIFEFQEEQKKPQKQKYEITTKKINSRWVIVEVDKVRKRKIEDKRDDKYSTQSKNLKGDQNKISSIASRFNRGAPSASSESRDEKIKRNSLVEENRKSNSLVKRKTICVYCNATGLCPKCLGKGVRDRDFNKQVTCSVCYGKGYEKFGKTGLVSKCSECGGRKTVSKGYKKEVVCEECHGKHLCYICKGKMFYEREVRYKDLEYHKRKFDALMTGYDKKVEKRDATIRRYKSQVKKKKAEDDLEQKKRHKIFPIYSGYIRSWKDWKFQGDKKSKFQPGRNSGFVTPTSISSKKNGRMILSIKDKYSNCYNLPKNSRMVISYNLTGDVDDAYIIISESKMGLEKASYSSDYYYKKRLPLGRHDRTFIIDSNIPQYFTFMIYAKSGKKKMELELFKLEIFER